MFFCVCPLVCLAATRALSLGDADRGKTLVSDLGCVNCHSLGGKGAKLAPDLGARVGRSYSPASFASLIWNHAPRMWSAFQDRQIPIPAVSGQQAADLFAYFFSLGYFDLPGDRKRGERAFRQKRCVNCHGAGAAPEWQSINDPIALTQRMWDHSVEVVAAANREKVPFPELTSQDMSDILAYVSAPKMSSPARFNPGPAESGENLFRQKGCASCHQGEHSLEERPTRYTLYEIAASLWNHPVKAPRFSPQLTYDEMRRLIGYLMSAQFLVERGELERGRQLFLGKRCANCHDNPSSGAPGRSQMAGRMTSYGMLSALWKHGPQMLNRMQQSGISWPRLDAQEMADLTAYLHGTEFKRRRGATPAR